MVRLFSHYFSTNTLLQIALEAALLFAAIFLGAMLQYPVGGAAVSNWLFPAFLFAVFMLAMIGVVGLYQHRQPQNFIDAAARILFAFLLGVPVFYAILGWLPCAQECVDALPFNSLLAMGTTLAARAAFFTSVGTRAFSRRVMVLGTGTDAASVEHALKTSAFRHIRIVGFYPLDHAEVAVSPHRVLPRNLSIVETAQQRGVDEIIVAMQERRGDVLALDQLLSCKLEGIRVCEQSTFFESIRDEVRIDSLRASWLIYGEGFRQGRLRTFVKRSFDLSASLLLLALTLPVMLAAAIAIALESSGPVIYRQERVGRGGKHFDILKFRSMRNDAEADGTPRWANANDSRVTRVGQFIRRTRIDELPQILNVIKGDMSFVGPRPERPYFVAQLTQQIPFYAARHSVKPGITGWAQVSYKYGSSIDDALHKLQFDLFYVKNHTLFLDIRILLKTVKVVISGDGAH